MILRGARQTGKTSLINQFSREFANTVSLNLELSTERRLWEGDPTAAALVRLIEVQKQAKIIPGQTLLFFDEVQNEPRAIATLRYLYETFPDLHIIATGSLLEVSLKNKGFSFPVGRVFFLYLYPLTFDEFLYALGRTELLQELCSQPIQKKIPPSLHALASDFFADFLSVGGMPECVEEYCRTGKYLSLRPLQEGLLTSFEEDVPKYVTSQYVPYLQFLVRQAPLFAGQRVTYHNFANSGFRSREMRQAFETLEQAMILQRIHGTIQTTPPLQPMFRVHPKLLYLDVGIVGYRLSVDPLAIKQGDLNDLFRGTLAEQIVGQELLAQNSFHREPPLFWYRQQPGSTAEVDYCLNLKGHVIPIEVKSGASGRLRSLLQFMETAPHPYGVRIYSGELRVDHLSTPKGKSFQLLSLPFYLTFRLKNILEQWIK